MGRRNYLPLKQSELIAIIDALGFRYKHTVGSHAQYERPATVLMLRRVVTVDLAIREFAERLLRSMVSQSGFTCDQFYGATPKTAKRASVPLYVVPFEDEAPAKALSAAD